MKAKVIKDYHDLKAGTVVNISDYLFAHLHKSGHVEHVYTVSVDAAKEVQKESKPKGRKPKKVAE